MPFFGYRITREISHKEIRRIVKDHITSIFAGALGGPLTPEDWKQPIIELAKKTNRVALHLVQEVLNRLHKHPKHGARFLIAAPANTETLEVFVKGSPIQMQAYIVMEVLDGGESHDAAIS